MTLIGVTLFFSLAQAKPMSVKETIAKATEFTLKGDRKKATDLIWEKYQINKSPKLLKAFHKLSQITLTEEGQKKIESAKAFARTKSPRAGRVFLEAIALEPMNAQFHKSYLKFLLNMKLEQILQIE